MDNLPFIDILIFAVIAILLVLRLRSVLGQRTGYEQPQESQVKERFTDKAKAPNPFQKANKSAKVSGSGLDALKSADRHFSETDFVKGATSAFEMILTAYADGDQAQLQRLLSYDLSKSFMQTITDRIAAKETLEITVNEIKEVSILNIELADGTTGGHNNNDGTFRYNLIILINNGSASASEIVAGALKDHKRAIILGENSYGKGSVQSIIPLRNGGGMRLTISKYYLPSGSSISEVGVTPDIFVEEEGDDFKIKSSNDNQLNYALKLLNS